MMFLHIFCYQLKNLFRKKYIIGWNLLFPLVLATAFYIGFGHMVTKDPNAFQTIAAGYAEVQSVSGIPEEGTESGNAEFFLKTLEQLQTEGGKNMIDLTRYHSEKEAREALLDGQIEGYYHQGGRSEQHHSVADPETVPFRVYHGGAGCGGPSVQAAADDRRPFRKPEVSGRIYAWQADLTVSSVFLRTSGDVLYVCVLDCDRDDGVDVCESVRVRETV